MGRILVTAGPDQGRIFELGENQIVGRQARNGVPLSDTRASREHARIEKSSFGYTLIDLGSKNGTLVNGERVDRFVLSPGDSILVGETYMTIEFEAGEFSSSPRASSAQASALAEEVVQVRGRAGSVSDEPLRTAHTKAKRAAAPTRTSLAWLRTDLAQTSWLYRWLVQIGLVVLAGALSYLAFRLVKGS